MAITIVCVMLSEAPTDGFIVLLNDSLKLHKGFSV